MILSVFQESYAASVPITTPALFGTGRNTCDPEFWDVLKDRAWMEAQREVTQNQNLFPRPDSVLEMTCFDSFLDELGSHADSHFPSHPRYSQGAAPLGVSVIYGILSLDQTVLNAEPLIPSPLFVPSALFHGGSGSGGLIMTAVLEVLVLDQLVDGVTVAGLALDILNNPLLVACAAEGTKQYYLEHFSGDMLGARAINVTPPPQPSPPLPYSTGVAWSRISAGNADGDVSDSGNYNGCTKMNDLWNRTKCYDFATESHRHVTLPDTPIETPPEAPPFPPASLPPPGGEHDSFYTLERYHDMAAAGDDYRKKEQTQYRVKNGLPQEYCDIPAANGEPDWPSGGEFLCDVVVHGLPSGLDISTFISGLGLVFNDSPTWDSAYTGANPPPNASPASSNGGVDMYLHFLDLQDSSSCSALTPIKTGYIVVLPSGVQYIDAICSAPGCVFNPPANIGLNGTCSN
ncbi:MAG: hypothetical protein COB36_01530 [Alphaproteobacteria bacterium]|nr:MAG: hypothetical protein COB36_01530 [Alphaproteobacteria bacterium]